MEGRAALCCAQHKLPAESVGGEDPYHTKYSSELFLCLATLLPLFEGRCSGSSPLYLFERDSCTAVPFFAVAYVHFRSASARQPYPAPFSTQFACRDYTLGAEVRYQQNLWISGPCAVDAGLWRQAWFSRASLDRLKESRGWYDCCCFARVVW